MKSQEMVTVLQSLPPAIQWTLYFAVATLVLLTVAAGVLASRRTTVRIAEERRLTRRELAALYAEIIEKDPGPWHPIVVPGSSNPMLSGEGSAT